MGIWDSEGVPHFHMFTPATQVPRQRAKPGSFLLSLVSPASASSGLPPSLSAPVGLRLRPGPLHITAITVVIVVAIKYLSAGVEKKTNLFLILTANLG